jgi:hypothetical protein
LSSSMEMSTVTSFDWATSTSDSPLNVYYTPPVRYVRQLLPIDGSKLKLVFHYSHSNVEVQSTTTSSTL